MFKNRVGSLPYEVEDLTGDQQLYYKRFEVSQQLKDSDRQFVELMSGSKFSHREGLPSPKKIQFMKDKLSTDHGFRQLNRVESDLLESVNQVYLEDPEAEEEKFDNQNFIVGSQGRTRFWELYKSERKFKDQDEDTPIMDPRFAYFQQCKDLHINPRASQIIVDKESPLIEYTNQFLNSATSVKAVCEAIKRYGYHVTMIKFVNNSIRMRDAINIIDSFERHMPNLQILNMSENNLGVEGGKHLAKNIHKMIKLIELNLKQCTITDRGIIEIVTALDELGTLDIIDLSGN